MVFVPCYYVLEREVIHITAYLALDAAAEVHAIFQRAEERDRLHGDKGPRLDISAYADALHKI